MGFICCGFAPQVRENAPKRRARPDPPKARTSSGEMPRISEDLRRSEEERRNLEGRPSRPSLDDDREPLKHRIVSQPFVSGFLRPSASVNARHSRVPGASDPRGDERFSTPTEEEIRKFYALYGPNLPRKIPDP